MKQSVKHWHRLLECNSGVEELKKHGNSKGLSTRFAQLDEYMTLKLGTTIYFYGAPFSGKSEIIAELILNSIQAHGWRVVVFSPESGTKDEIVAEMASKWLMRPFYNNVQGCMTEVQMYRAMTELNENLFIIDPGYNDITVDQIFEQVDDIEKEVGRIHMVVIDPWNELKHDFGKDNNRQDLYLENKLGLIRRNAQEKSRLNIVSTHIQDQAYHEDKDTKIRFYPAASAREIAGGQAWYRKGMNMISVWRPPYGLKDEHGIPYPENEVRLIIQKYKPKGVGKRGSVKLYFDHAANRYYELVDGLRKFAAATNPEKEVF